jgi:hypothetical protein
LTYYSAFAILCFRDWAGGFRQKGRERMKPGQKIYSNDARGLMDWYFLEESDGIVAAIPTTATAEEKGDTLVESFAAAEVWPADPPEFDHNTVSNGGIPF